MKQVDQEEAARDRAHLIACMVELLTKCDCDVLEGRRGPNNTPIREVSATDAALDC